MSAFPNDRSIRGRVNNQLPSACQQSSMRSLDQDVPRTISKVLSTHDWRGRKELIDKVFTEDAKFWHFFFQTVNRKELFGVYQMWGEQTASTYTQFSHPATLRLIRGWTMSSPGLK